MSSPTSPLPEPSERSRTAQPVDLCSRIQQAVDAIERVIDSGISPRAGEAIAGYSRLYRQKLGILRALVDMPDPRLEPVLDPTAPLGHVWPEVEESLGLHPGSGREILAQLADHGLLEPELHNRVHACPDCGRCQINFREICPLCGEFEIQLERMIHHFSCAYIGLESEFQKGFDFVCPKCRKRLHQLGQDFERPHDTYICLASEHLFDEPAIEGQCLSCRAVHEGDALDVVPIHRYRPTHLTVRAVELNRLTGLDVSEIMYDVDLKLNTRDFLNLQVKRELFRIRRYGGALATVILQFEDEGGVHPIFREWSTNDLRDVARMLVGNLRELDLVARLDDSRFGILLLEADEEGAARPRDRILGNLEDYSLLTPTGRELVPVWRQRAWQGGDATLEEVLDFFDGNDAEEAA